MAPLTPQTPSSVPDIIFTGNGECTTNSQAHAVTHANNHGSNPIIKVKALDSYLSLDADTDHGLGGGVGGSNGGIGSSAVYDSGGNVCPGGGMGNGGAVDVNASIFGDLGKLDDPMHKLLDGIVSGVDEMTEEHLKS